MSAHEGFSSLWKKEDWWAVWLGFGILAFAVATAGLGYGIKAPGIQRWTDSPLDAFYSDVTVRVAAWPAGLQSSRALAAELPARTASSFKYTRKVGYQRGGRSISETIGWKSRYPMSEADQRDALLALDV